MKEITFVIRRNENDYIVYSEEFEHGYNVVPKDIDPYNAFDIEQVRVWCSNHVSSVVDEIEEDSKTPSDISEYKALVAEIESDIKYLNTTDDVAFQLARHERGTETLSPEKYASCMEKDRRRGEVASLLKRRRAEAAGRLEELRVKYGLALSILYEV
ncbi:MAG: hypothetical protein J5800_06280 [Spirochaetales bacterium]|nr:hypothetical protein [Spirochaetales bacterium]